MQFISHFVPNFSQFVPTIDLDVGQYLPAVPQRFYSSVGSTLLAAAVGAGYGLVGRMIYPKAGILPMHYAIWFALACQIRLFVLVLESDFEDFLEAEPFEKLEQIPEDDLLWGDLIRYHSWKVLHLKDRILCAIDHVFSNIVNIRSSDQVTEDNVADASFIEMCRYRMWPVFKMAVLDTASFALAHSLSDGMGFTLPDRTAIPLWIAIRSIVKDIILTPALYMYARMCNQIADHLDEGDELAATYRVEWIRWCLPKL